MELVPGTQLGQYRIVEQVGRGGMATVYKAFQPSLERYVAIKVLPAFYAEDPNFLERFRQEARAVSSLRHPNILTVFDYGEQEAVTFMVSEFLAGGTLEDLLAQPLDSRRALELLRPIADALDYAHSRGMLHRDVKPSNILLAERGEPVLTDFGVARMVAGTSRMTATGVAVGTPEYMAPEQAAGEGAEPASDQYALGIVLYEMLTGRTPFTGETPVAVALAHMHKPLPLPRSLNPDLPEEVEAVLLKVLAKAPGDRYESCKAVTESLRRALDAAPRTGAETPAVATRTAEAPPTAPQPLPVGPADPSEAPTDIGPAFAAAPAAGEPLERQAGAAAEGASGASSAAASTVPVAQKRPPWAILAAALALVVLIGLAALGFFAGSGPLALLGASRGAERQVAKPEPVQKPPPAAAQSPAPGPGAAAPPPAAPAAPPSPVAPAAPPPPLPAAKPEPPGDAQKPASKPERLAIERLLPQYAGRLGAVERDDFSNPSSGLFTNPANVPNSRVAYENGSLLMELSRKALNEPPGIGVFANRPANATNGIIETEARVVGGPDLAGFTVSFRRTAGGPNGYFLVVFPRRKQVAMIKQVGQEGADLGRVQVDALQPEGSNRAVLVFDGPEMQVLINGHQVLSARDQTFASGRVGLGNTLSSGPVLGDVRVVFDDFRYVQLR